MKLTKLISLLIVPLLFGLNSFSSQAKTLSLPVKLAQSEVEKKEEVMQDKSIKLLNLFFNKEFEEVREIISPKLKEQVSLQLLQNEWLQTISHNGAVQEILHSNVIETPQSFLVTVTIKFERVTDDWIVIFDKNQEIIGTDFPTSEQIEDIAVKVVNSLAIGKFDNARSYLHPFLKEDIFPEQVQSGWQEIQQENGDFERIISTDTRRGSSLGNADIVLVEIEFTKNTDEMLILFDRNKRIIGVDFPPNE